MNIEEIQNKFKILSDKKDNAIRKAEEEFKKTTGKDFNLADNINLSDFNSELKEIENSLNKLIIGAQNLGFKYSSEENTLVATPSMVNTENSKILANNSNKNGIVSKQRQEIDNILKQAENTVKETIKGISTTVESTIKNGGSLNDLSSTPQKFLDEILKEGKKSISAIGDIEKMSSAGDIIKLTTGGCFGPSKPIDYAQIAGDLLGNNSLLELQKKILGGKLAEITTITNIAEAISKIDFSKIGDIAENFFLSKKAYISAYIKNTFGNKEFMTKTLNKIGDKINEYMNSLTKDYLNSIGSKIESGFNKIFLDSNNIMSRITAGKDKIIDKFSQLTTLNWLNDKISKCTDLTNLSSILSGSNVGKLLFDKMGPILDTAKLSIKNWMSNVNFTSKIKLVSEKLKTFKEQITKYKDFVKQKVEMVKNYIENIKNQAIAAVTQFANTIISDITSKINIEGITGALGL